MNSVDPVSISCVLLVDRHGRILMQLRDGAARHPHMWGLPGGHGEPGESPEETAVRELREETGLPAPDGLLPLARQELPEQGLVKHYFCASTPARQEDVILGEGAAMLFVPPEQVLDGRPLTPGTRQVLARFLASPRAARLAEAAHRRAG